MIDKPQILTLNLTKIANQKLVDNGYNIYKGSLGKLVDTHNTKYELKYCLSNHDFPQNLHEFDILIIDLSNEETINYRKEDNLRVQNKSGNDNYLLCEHPQTIFDSRPLAAKLLSSGIKELMKKDSILIVFQNEKIDVEYQVVKENGQSPLRQSRTACTLYDFMPTFPFLKNKFGKETQVVIKNNDLGNFLNKYNSDFTYRNIYYHPTIWQEEKQLPDPKFIPLLKNANDEIISYLFIDNKTGIYNFPILNDNSSFILEFLQNIAPNMQPVVFPYSNQKKWTTQSEYALPNHLKLLEEKQGILLDFELKTKEKEIEIFDNSKKYSFLHDIITETGNELVSAVIVFLEWLGFENVVDMDTVTNNIKEEDIQIENEKGLLAIEVKGIGGTSKDSECSQISKIKYRRAKERSKFDVYGLYIVNHQRHLPPAERENPPFSKEQIQDAINDERGLLTTWQLFKLYNDIQKKIITKEEAKLSIYEYGLVNFVPRDIIIIGTVDEIFLKGEVFILNIDDISLKAGDKLFVERNNEFQELTILEIRIDNVIVEEASTGEVGIKGNLKVNKKSNIWKKNLP